MKFKTIGIFVVLALVLFSAIVVAAPREKAPFQCLDNGEELAFSRGQFSRSVPKYMCSGSAQYERICTDSGYKSRLTRCAFGCDAQTGQCLPEPEDVACNVPIGKRKTFILGGNNGEYRGADSLFDSVPKVQFRFRETGETVERPVEEKAVSTFRFEGEKYGFVSASDFNERNYDIELRYNCEADLECGDELVRRDLFTLADSDFQYAGATSLTIADPYLRIKNLLTRETVEISARTAAIFRLSYEGINYYFESVPGEDYEQDDYTIQLVYPCPQN